MVFGSLWIKCELGYAATLEEGEIRIHEIQKEFSRPEFVSRVPIGDYGLNFLDGRVRGRLRVGEGMYLMTGQDSNGELRFEGNLSEEGRIEVTNTREEVVASFFSGFPVKLPKSKKV